MIFNNKKCRIYAACVVSQTPNPSIECEGCSMLKVYNRNASKENMLDYLKKQLEIEKIVTFGTIEGKYTYLIKPGDFNRVVKLIMGRFKRNYLL